MGKVKEVSCVTDVRLCLSKKPGIGTHWFFFFLDLDAVSLKLDSEPHANLQKYFK